MLQVYVMYNLQCKILQTTSHVLQQEYFYYEHDRVRVDSAAKISAVLISTSSLWNVNVVSADNYSPHTQKGRHKPLCASLLICEPAGNSEKMEGEEKQV